MTDVEPIHKIIEVPLSIATRLQGYLKIKEPLSNYKIDGIIYCWTFNFGEGYKIDVLIKNEMKGPVVTARFTYTLEKSPHHKHVSWHDSRWKLEGTTRGIHTHYRDPITGKEVPVIAELRIKSNTKEFLEEEL
jgi:hypothetical protein